MCEFHFRSGDINVSVGQGKKTLKRNVVVTFEDLKKPVFESKWKPPGARKSLFEEIGGAFAGTNEQQNSRSIKGFLP